MSKSDTQPFSLSPGPGDESLNGTIRVPAHIIPIPESISPAARTYLIQRAVMPSMASVSGSTDAAALKRSVAIFDEMVGGFYAAMASSSNTSVETCTMGGVTVHIATRNEATSEERRKIHLYIHGGSFVFGGGKSAMYQSQLEARRFGGTTVSIDYRMPPDHPYPAALDDCLAVYQDLLKEHPASAIFVSGESAGGNLAAALMHKALDASLPAPGALFLFTPVTDMEVAGDSRQVNLHADVVLKDGVDFSAYTDGADLTSPYLSPLRGDLANAFPPTYIRSGTRDLLLSDAVRMHAALRKSGIAAELYVGEAMPHSGFPDNVAEQVDAVADVQCWLERVWRD